MRARWRVTVSWSFGSGFLSWAALSALLFSFVSTAIVLLSSLGLHVADRQRDVADVHGACGFLVPVVAAMPTVLDHLPEGLAVGAQRLELGALGRRHVGCEAHARDRRVLLGLLVEAEAPGAARQHRELLDALHDPAHDGDVAVEQAC